MDEDQSEAIPLKAQKPLSYHKACPDDPPACTQFLKLVGEDAVGAVRKLLEEDPSIDTSVQDELGRPAMVIAIDQDNYDMIQCLCELTLDPEDALLHAIETHSTHAIDTMCDHLPPDTKIEVLNRYPKTHRWPVTTVPLLLAARLENNVSTVKTLIKHGAVIPPLEELQQRVCKDSYGNFLASIHWYEANSDNAYIVITSKDPVKRIFELGKSLEQLQNSFHVPRSKQLCENIGAKLSALSVRMLNLTRDDKEVDLLLNGGAKNTPHPSVPLRIQQAIDVGFKEFVSHPSCQDYMVSQWQLSSPYHDHLNGGPWVKTALLHVFMVTFFFIPCLVYTFIPSDNVRLQMKRPFVRFMLTLSSRLYFLFLLVISTLDPMQYPTDVVPPDPSELNGQTTRVLNYKTKSWDACMILIISWIIGMTVAKVQHIWTVGIQYYATKQPWSLLEVTQLILYWIYIALNIVAYVKNLQETLPVPSKLLRETVQDEVEQPLVDTVQYGMQIGDTRFEWNQHEPLLIAEAAFSVANVLTFLHLLHCLLVVESLGPLLVSMRGMMADVCKFLVIFIFVLVSFAIGLTQLYRTFEALDKVLCEASNKEASNKEDCPETPFLSFSNSMWSLFWSLFNPIELHNLTVDKDLYFTSLVGASLYATFMLLGVVVLLNALIAMMSNTYTRVEENSDVEWKVARTKLMSEYMSLRVTVPPPFNLIPSVKSITRFTRYVRRKCSQSDSAQANHAGQPLSDTDDAYMELSRDLAERCRRKCKMEEVTEAHQSKRQQDMDLLKKAVENMSQEMKELRQQIQQSSAKKNNVK
ncbi:transient receptor potential-gamma protein-like [Asterias amurensis]|uniref:transient receptor potential-gamma protein-like n=1 Tax=Asterias amurensis TaxID=7602 RepID=UPI003AB6FABC